MSKMQELVREKLFQLCDEHPHLVNANFPELQNEFEVFRDGKQLTVERTNLTLGERKHIGDHHAALYEESIDQLIFAMLLRAAWDLETIALFAGRSDYGGH